jgi:hypothetical protein
MIHVLDALPLWAAALLTVLIALASFEIGRRVGRRREGENPAAIGTFVGSGMGLLAFFLAFTFGVAASRFEARREVMLREANAIGTAYLRANLVPQPHRSEIQKILREYADVRIEAARSGNVERAVARSEELHGRLWAEVTGLAELDPRSIVGGLQIESVNELIDVHQMRVAAATTRIPPRVWDVLFGLTALAMVGVGFQAGQSGPKRSPVILVLALAFASVVLVIVDLDRPLEGSLRVSQQPLLDTRRSMGP